MEAKHTPGPWDVMTFSDPTHPETHSVTTRSGLVVANVPRLVGANPYAVPASAQEANARLISQAPAMLEALQAAEWSMKHTNSDYCPALERVRAAIARATGGEQIPEDQKD